MPAPADGGWTVARALGRELRLEREKRGWSRGELVARLPSGIGERTLLSYEHGARQLTVLRLIELCRGLGVTAPTLMAQALQRARINLANIELTVDLRRLLADPTPMFRPMHQWATGKLDQCEDGVVTVTVSPLVVRELAVFAGYAVEDLARYLARFLPEDAVPMMGDRYDTYLVGVR